jgi:hypothetical protein
MKLHFIISMHKYEVGTVFDDGFCYGAYIEVGNDETFHWFQAQGYEGNGYTILALVNALCKSEMPEELNKIEMEAEADNTWVYSREKKLIDDLIEKFVESTRNVDNVKRLLKYANPELLE